MKSDKGISDMSIRNISKIEQKFVYINFYQLWIFLYLIFALSFSHKLYCFTALATCSKNVALSSIAAFPHIYLS